MSEVTRRLATKESIDGLTSAMGANTQAIQNLPNATQAAADNANAAAAEAERVASIFKDNMADVFAAYRIIEGETISTSGVPGVSPFENAKRTNIINTRAGDKWKYFGRGDYQIAAASYYNNGVFVSYESTDHSPEEKTFTVPANCDGVAFSSYGTANFDIQPITESSGNAEKKAINNITNSICDLFGDYRIISGEIINLHGDFVVSQLANAKRTNIINTRPGDLWGYYGRGDYEITAVAYYKDGEFVSKESTDHQAEQKNFTVPAGCNGIAFSSYGTANFNIIPRTEKSGATNATKIWSGKKWCAIGDSITEKYSGQFADVVQYWQYIIDETGINFVNCATSGRGYKNAENYDDAFYQKANVSKYPDLADADIITVYGSCNDMGQGYTLGDITDTGTSTLCGAINTTIDNLYVCNPTAVIGIITPCPTVGYNYAGVQDMEQYSNKIAEICARRSVPCLNLYYESGFHPQDAAFKNAMFINNDGVHPNSAGHKMMYPHFLEFMKTLI